MFNFTFLHSHARAPTSVDRCGMSSPEECGEVRSVFGHQPRPQRTGVRTRIGPLLARGK